MLFAEQEQTRSANKNKGRLQLGSDETIAFLLLVNQVWVFLCGHSNGELRSMDYFSCISLIAGQHKPCKTSPDFRPLGDASQIPNPGPKAEVHTRLTSIKIALAMDLKATNRRCKER